MRVSERVMEKREKLKDAIRHEYRRALHDGREMDRKGVLILADALLGQYPSLGSQEALRLTEETVLAEDGLND